MSCDCFFTKDLESSVDHIPFTPNSTRLCSMFSVAHFHCGIVLSFSWFPSLTHSAFLAWVHLIWAPELQYLTPCGQIPGGQYHSSLIISQCHPAFYYPLGGETKSFPCSLWTLSLFAFRLGLYPCW